MNLHFLIDKREDVTDHALRRTLLITSKGTKESEHSMAIQIVEVEFTQPGKPAAGTPKDAEGNYILPKYKSKQIADTSTFTVSDPAALVKEFLSVVGGAGYQEIADSFMHGWNTRERLRGAGMLVDNWVKQARLFKKANPAVAAVPDEKIAAMLKKQAEELLAQLSA